MLVFVFAATSIIFTSCSKDNPIDPPPSLQVLNPTVRDIDGNVYNTVTIGTQVWMASNLQTTKYNDGTDIPLVTDDSDWANLTSPGYCWYNNDMSYKSIYGALYNWYTVNTGKLCPTGWHVPTKDEWDTLILFAGGSKKDAAVSLREVGRNHWDYTHYGFWEMYGRYGNDQYGFTALPGGYRDGEVPAAYPRGYFYGLTIEGNWWSSTQSYRLTASVLNIGSFAYMHSIMLQSGASVRCIKD